VLHRNENLRPVFVQIGKLKTKSANDLAQTRQSENTVHNPAVESWFLTVHFVRCPLGLAQIIYTNEEAFDLQPAFLLPKVHFAKQIAVKLFTNLKLVFKNTAAG